MKKYFICLIILFFISCSSKTIVKKTELTQKKYLFKIGNTIITPNEFFKEIKYGIDKSKLNITEKDLENFTENYISNRILVNLARYNNLDKTDTFIYLKKSFEDRILLELFNKDIENKVKFPTELEVYNYYKNNKDKKFYIPEKVHIKSILANDSKTIIAIYQELEKGVSFDSIIVSAKYKIKAGDIGIISKGMTFPEIEKYAFNLKKGQYSTIIKTPIGYHIVYCIEKFNKQYIPFNKVKKTIYKLIIEEKMNNVLKDKIKLYKQTHKILINKKELKKILNKLR